MAFRSLLRSNNPIVSKQLPMMPQSYYMLNPCSLLQQPQRHFVKSMEERKEDQDRKAFQDDVQYFLGKNTFSLHDFHERVLHGLKQKSTFKVMIWGEDAEIKVLENQNKICSSMYDDEKNDYKLLSRFKKQEIAEITQLQLSDVQDVIHKYVQMKEFHNWLKGKQARKEPMPESREELMQLYRIERPSFLMPKGHRGSSKRSQLPYMIRRHHT
eukprot:403332646